MVFSELVTLQGEEPRSLTAGQSLPAEVSQQRPQSRDWVLWSPEVWAAAWMSDARQTQPIGRGTQQSPEQVHQHDQSLYNHLWYQEVWRNRGRGPAGAWPWLRLSSCLTGGTRGDHPW